MDIYGSVSFEDFYATLKSKFAKEINLTYFQSNIEGEIINFIHTQPFDAAIINGGGYSHSSVAIADAIAAIIKPFINIHISNIYNREIERHIDLLSKYCKAGMYGLGLESYDYAVQYLINYLKKL